MLMEMTSLSLWPPQLYQPRSVEAIEKHRSALRRPDLISTEDLSMENAQLLEADTDSEAFLCVNPYEVNPIAADSTGSHLDDICVAPQKGEINVVQQNSPTTSCRGFYGIKLEMEEFGDISSYLPPRPMSTNSVDELTTPTFELKDGFDFGLSNYETRVRPRQAMKVERDAFCRLSYATPTEKNKDFFYGPETPRNDNISSEIRNIDSLGHAELYSPASDNGTYIYNETTVTDSVNDSALSVNSYNMQLEEGARYLVDGLDTPDDSNSSAGSSPKKRTISLDVSVAASEEEVISTPAIIAEVVDLEAGDFNILDLIKDDNLALVTSDDIFQTSSTYAPPAQTPTAKFLSKFTAYEVPSKQPRKRRKRDDDDDDYTPPTKKCSSQQRHAKVLREDSDSDSECESNKSRARGRRPGRTDSITSDCSRDGDVSKYRELRDKNNEASRKSRQKRKNKELELEKEADELRNRNIKLKAQVEELEKMVNNFRDNLFKIMITKK